MKSFPTAYQGLPGSYSHQAIREFAEMTDLPLEADSRENFYQLFNAIDKDTKLGMVPIENSTAGSVVECYDRFSKYRFNIIAEYLLPVRHCLVGLEGSSIDQIKTVYSHPQALAQCSNFIDQNGWQGIAFGDTAGSANYIKETRDPNKAAIASAFAAQIYGLVILQPDIQDHQDNTTRFLLTKQGDTKWPFESKIPEPNKTTVMFEARDLPAALFKCLGGFATNGVNLVKIESRPIRGKKFEYLFYIDFEGILSDRSVQLAMEELTFFSDRVITLGSYPRHFLSQES